MNNIVVSDDIKIENMIYEIRDKQVMLDSDLVKLYGCKNGTKSLNLAVKRHINRFPENYCFQITTAEYISLGCHFGTLKNGRGEHRKYPPYVFTEYGITVLAGILKRNICKNILI